MSDNHDTLRSHSKTALSIVAQRVIDRLGNCTSAHQDIQSRGRMLRRRGVSLRCICRGYYGRSAEIRRAGRLNLTMHMFTAARVRGNVFGEMISGEHVRSPHQCRWWNGFLDGARRQHTKNVTGEMSPANRRRVCGDSLFLGGHSCSRIIDGKVYSRQHAMRGSDSQHSSLLQPLRCGNKGAHDWLPGIYGYASRYNQ